MGKFLFRLARLRIMGTIVGIMFAYFPFLIPVTKIKQNRSATSFYHPSASYPDHVLIIPRKIARTVFHLSHDDFLQVIDMATKIRVGDNRDFVLLINGGDRQDVMQAHFHLFTDNMASRHQEKGTVFCLNDGLFWEQTVANLRKLLKQNRASEKSFSILIQFCTGTKPSLFFT